MSHKGRCSGGTIAADVSIDSGAAYLSSSVVSKTGYGSYRCPYYVSPNSGQRINITLLDFKLKQVDQVGVFL